MPGSRGAGVTRPAPRVRPRAAAGDVPRAWTLAAACVGLGVPPPRGHRPQADLVLRQRPRLEDAAVHAGLDPLDQVTVLGVDDPVDAPVEITRRPGLAARIGQAVGDFPDQRPAGPERDHLHEVELLGIDVEGEVRPQQVVIPAPTQRPRQMRELRKEPAVGPAGRPGRGPGGDVGAHMHHVLPRLEPVTVAGETREPTMRHGDMQPVGVVFDHRLPVDRPLPQRDPPEGGELPEPVVRQGVRPGRHHLRHAGSAGQAADEDEALPDLELRAHQAVVLPPDARVGPGAGHGDQSAVEVVAPGVIGAYDPAALTPSPAARIAGVQQPRGPMPTHVVERVDPAFGATDDDDRPGQEIEQPVIAGLRDVVDVTNDLPGRQQNALHFQPIKALVAVDPGRQPPG
jgi:hypothetical protein